MQFLIQMKGCCGVILPIGKIYKGGTCEFMTKECEKFCSAKVAFPNELYYLKMKNTLKLIKKKKPSEIAAIFLEDIKETDEKILHWFAAGDCPTIYINKIKEVMKIIDDAGIIQLGFTRQKIGTFDYRSVNMIYTIEEFNFYDTLNEFSRKVNEFDRNCYLPHIAVPNYKEGITRIISSEGGRTVGCGTYELMYSTVKKTNNCTDCFVEKLGCFSKRMEVGMDNHKSTGREIELGKLPEEPGERDIAFV